MTAGAPTLERGSRAGAINCCAISVWPPSILALLASAHHFSSRAARLFWVYTNVANFTTEIVLTPASPIL